MRKPSTKKNLKESRKRNLKIPKKKKKDKLRRVKMAMRDSKTEKSERERECASIEMPYYENKLSVFLSTK